MGRAARILLGLSSGAALLVLVLAALLIALSQGFQRERLRQAVETALSRTLGTGVAIGALEGRLVPDLVLRDVRIGPEDDPQIELERLAVRLAGYAPTRGHLRVESFEARGVRWALAAEGDAAPAIEPVREETAAGLAWLRRIEVGRVELREIELRLEWGDGPHRMQLRAGAYAERLAWPLDDASVAAIEGRLAGEFSGPELRVGSRPLGPAYGRIGARLSGGELHLETLEAGVGARVLSLESEASVGLRSDGIDVEGLQLAGETTSLAISGSIGPEAFRDVTVIARGIDVATLAPLFELPIAVAGRIDADVHLDGAFERPGIRAAGLWEDAQVGRMRRGRLHVDLNAAGRELRTDLRSEIAGAEVGHASIRLDYDEALRGELSLASDVQVEVRSEELELALLEPLLPEPLQSLAGIGRLDLRLRGGPVPSAEGWLEVQDGSILLPVLGRSLAPFRARLVLRPDPEGLGVEALRLETPLGELEGSGVVTTHGLRGARLALRRVDASALARQLAVPSEVGGELAADFQVDGPFARPAVTGAILWSQPRLGRMRRGLVRVDLHAAGRELRTDLRSEIAGAEVGHASIRLDYDEALRGELSLASDVQVEVRSEELELALLEPLLPEPLQSPAGIGRMDLRLRGGPVPSAEGWLEVEDGSILLPVLGRSLAPFRARLVLRPDPEGLGVEALRLETPLGELEGSGVVSTHGLRGARLALRRVDVSALARQLAAPSELGGQLSADLQVDGPFARPAVTGALLWSEPRLGGASATRLTLEIEADDVELRGVAQVVESDREALVARAALPRPEGLVPEPLLGAGGRIEIEGSNFDLATLSPILPRQLRDMAGRADLELLAEGRAAGPHLTGELRIADAALSVPLLGARYEPIDGRIRLDGRQLLPELRVGAAEARATLAGRVELDALRPAAADLELTLERFALARSRLLHADVSGAMQLSGPIEELALRGALRLDQGRIRVPEAEDPALREIRIVTRETLEGETALFERQPTRPGALDRARVDLAVDLPRNTWVRGRGLEIELEGDLGVEKSPLGPLRYVGTVSVVRGRYELLGKRFEVRRGSTTFDGSERLDPLLDIEATHRVRDVTILAYVTGRVSDPVLRLDSEPSLEQDDVVSYLFLGRPADEAGAGSGSLDDAAAKLAAGLAVKQIAGLLGKSLPIDTLDVRIGEKGVPEQVGVGVYVTPDLYMRYGRTFGSEPVDEVGIELRLSDQWSIESEMTGTAGAGADLIWSLDF